MGNGRLTGVSVCMCVGVVGVGGGVSRCTHAYVIVRLFARCYLYVGIK